MWKILLKWMIFRGTPICGTRHLPRTKIQIRRGGGHLHGPKEAAASTAGLLKQVGAVKCHGLTWDWVETSKEKCLEFGGCYTFFVSRRHVGVKTTGSWPSMD